ncbi:hypothetical protein ACQEU6_25745 [Spirillospora sp. CA-108201]
MTPEQISADTLYQRAVVRVYGPWPSMEILADEERRRAAGRIRHARLMLTLRNAEPWLSPPAMVRFNRCRTRR